MKIQCAGIKLSPPMAKDDFLQHINAFAEAEEIQVQAMNPDLVFGELHLISAAEHAAAAFESSSNSCNTLAMETMLYASGERQIKDALEKMGLPSIVESAAIVCIGETDALIAEKLGAAHDNTLLEPDLDKLSVFGLTEAEISTAIDPIDLVIERVAMVEVLKK